MKTLKKILKITGVSLIILLLVLCIHIYIETRPTPPTAETKFMARIDFKQDITNKDSAKITNWLYQQTGIDHVLVNPNSNMAVFTFFPVKTNADQIVNNLKATFAYNAQRFVPNEKDLQSGCPVAKTSFTYKVYSFFKNL